MVYFVGAGTGAPDLITVRGMRLLKQADVIIYAGSLVNPELLSYAGKECETYNSACMTLSEVTGVMCRAEAQGKTTVRLHTGEPSIYGAVREQMDELDKRHIPYESCPGVSACFGAAASLNLEYTLPGISQSLIITRMEGKTDVPQLESIESLAAHRTSMAVYLSAGMLRELGQRLIRGGYEKDTPAALVYKATWPEEEACICTVETLYDTAKKHGISKTALVLVGDVITHRNYQKSRLYAPDFSTEFRQAVNPQSRSVTNGGENERITLSIISFTESGQRLSEKIKQEMTGIEIFLFSKTQNSPEINRPFPIQAVDSSVGEWAGRQMRSGNALLFIGACGIAVRAVAPYLTDKLTDSPVLVMDERGNHVIPLLSGHMGGANELAREIAGRTGAEPVITTATDLNGAFAVDLFAKKNELFPVEKSGIAKVSSKVLSGKKITISIENGHWKAKTYAPKRKGEPGKCLSEAGPETERQLPETVRLVPYPPVTPVDVVITSEENRFESALLLKPKQYVIGFGCKRGTGYEKIETFLSRKLSALSISHHEIYALASISQKRDEPGILTWCREKRIPFLTYTAEELQEAEGDFTESIFVKSQVGVGNVCERAALKTCGAGGQLICKKEADNGMTIAVGKREWSVAFDET